MMFKFSGALLRLNNYKKQIPIEADTIENALDKLISGYPGLKEALLDNAGHLRATHCLFLNGEQLESGDLMHPLAAQDALEIMTPIAGG